MTRATRVTIGTRGSALAFWQANAVADALRAASPGCDVRMRTIATTGDRVLDVPLEDIGDKGLFTKELETALLAGEVDLCVHSMKDMPSELPTGCVIGAMLPRADARDVLVCGPRVSSTPLADMPVGTRIGTGSMRRSAQLRAWYPHIEPKPIRGNVDTRLAKAEGPDYEGVVLAAAGVQRMGASRRIACFLPVEQMVPAVGQGAIGVEVREGDSRIAGLCKLIDSVPTSRCVGAERRVLAALEGGCQAPIGAFVRFQGDEVLFDAVVLSTDGSRMARAVLRRTASCDLDEAAYAVLEQLRAGGADEILCDLAVQGSGGDE